MTDIAYRSASLLQRFERIQRSLHGAGIRAVDMRRAGTLETDVLLPTPTADMNLDAPTIAPLEGEMVHHPISRKNESQFRWFIDGSQKTMPVMRIGIVPIVVGITVSGVLERTPDRQCQILPGSMRESVSWLIPTQTGDPQIRATVDILESLGETVVDPLDKQENYHQLAGMYDQLLGYANERAGDVRVITEQDALNYWRDVVAPNHDSDWLLVDGRLTSDVPHAIGFVKDPGRQHLFGNDAVTLYNLPPGHRTSAYMLEEKGRVRTHWYQRMWPSDGLDARHALIRIETSPEVQSSDQIDEIASWLMAERVPRPTADSRWPTLLYPVHLLERLLKRRIADITAGWPV